MADLEQRVAKLEKGDFEKRIKALEDKLDKWKDTLNDNFKKVTKQDELQDQLDKDFREFKGQAEAELDDLRADVRKLQKGK